MEREQIIRFWGVRDRRPLAKDESLLEKRPGRACPCFKSQGGMTLTFQMGPEGHLNSVEVKGKREREGTRPASDVCEDASATLPGAPGGVRGSEEVAAGGRRWALLPPPPPSDRTVTADEERRGCGKTDVPGHVLRLGTPASPPGRWSLERELSAFGSRSF